MKPNTKGTIPIPMPGEDLGTKDTFNYIPSPENCVVQDDLKVLIEVYHGHTDDLWDIANLMKATELFQRYLENRLKHHANEFGVDLIHYKEPKI